MALLSAAQHALRFSDYAPIAQSIIHTRISAASAAFMSHAVIGCRGHDMQQEAADGWWSSADRRVGGVGGDLGQTIALRRQDAD
jgi:hypothetical protein